MLKDLFHLFDIAREDIWPCRLIHTVDLPPPTPQLPLYTEMMSRIWQQQQQRQAMRKWEKRTRERANEKKKEMGSRMKSSNVAMNSKLDSLIFDSPSMEIQTEHSHISPSLSLRSREKKQQQQNFPPLNPRSNSASAEPNAFLASCFFFQSLSEANWISFERETHHKLRSHSFNSIYDALWSPHIS